MHSGHSVAVAMWAMTSLSLGLLSLRLYTRVRVVRFVGVEDHLYFWTGVLLLGFAISIQVAVHYGLGRSFWTLSLDDSSDAIFWTYVANTFAVTGNAIAKLSMGFFLLRVVQLRWQKAALWLLIFVTAATSIALAIMLWNQTTPVKASWDPLRTPAKWNIQIQPMSVGLGAWSSICDFFFAVFPWMFIWSLHMPRREKIMLASGMSLGVIAGACGIVRTVVLSRLDIMDYTLNFATYFVWAGAEIAVAMVCLGIPTLRPLYLRRRSTSIGYGDHHTAHRDDPESPQFTMCEPKEQPPSTPPSEKAMPGQVPRPQSPNFLRDSASSHTVVESTPSTDGTPLTKPPPAHTKGHNNSDSVDDILGLYKERSRSRGRSHQPPVGGPSGVIWVKNEVTVNREQRHENWPLQD
ncbi:hypothetical protein VTI74DRAFT_11078 [Chaetomium olivicolor]